MKKYNFSAGPAILPKSVFEEAAHAVTDYQGKGLSLLELSHRGPEITAILEEARSLPLELLGLSKENYEVLYLTGGASSQFFMTAMNFLGEDRKGYYLDSGTWSKKAIKEAKLFGQVEVLASSADQNYDYINKEFDANRGGAYLHYTSNNTIFGTQYHYLPQTDMPLICDMSSDIFSRPLYTKDYGLIYAGAQKNLGPAGTTLVIINKKMIPNISKGLTSMLDYTIHVDKKSTFNTPPVYPIYVSLLTLRWIKDQGGLEAMKVKNHKKAETLYSEIDNNPLFKGVVSQKEDRSQMNATFVCQNDAHSDRFLELCNQAGIVGIKGHRSVGGFRASIYNAMNMEGIERLIQVMQDLKNHI